MSHNHVCGIVPPHLLQAIAESQHNTQAHRQTALATLNHLTDVRTKRAERLQALNQPRGFSGHAAPRPSIVPDHLLQAIIDSS